MLKQAFNAVTKMKSRPATLKRRATPSDLTSPISITPSNYFRNNEGPSAVVIKGREFIIPYDSITNKFSAPIVKRGDYIIDVDLGQMAITEVIELYDVGSAILGWRCRCE
jgi:hypothetical protein